MRYDAVLSGIDPDKLFSNDPEVKKPELSDDQKVAMREALAQTQARKRAELRGRSGH